MELGWGQRKNSVLLRETSPPVVSQHILNPPELAQETLSTQPKNRPQEAFLFLHRTVWAWLSGRENHECPFSRELSAHSTLRDLG